MLIRSAFRFLIDDRDRKWRNYKSLAHAVSFYKAEDRTETESPCTCGLWHNIFIHDSGSECQEDYIPFTSLVHTLYCTTLHCTQNSAHIQIQNEPKKMK